MRRFLIALAIAVAAGCSSSDDEVTSPPSSATPQPEASETTTTEPLAPTGVDGPVVRHLDPISPEEEGAEIRGAVVIDGDCVYIESTEASRYSVVWPAATSWKGDESLIVFSDGQSVTAGDAVSGAGGYYALDRVAAFAGEEGASAIAPCLRDSIAVFNNQPGDIEVTPGPRENTG